LSSSSGKRDSGIEFTKISKIVEDGINPRGRGGGGRISSFGHSTSYIIGNQYLPACDTNEMKEIRGNESVSVKKEKCQWKQWMRSKNEIIYLVGMLKTLFEHEQRDKIKIRWYHE
jgi:hypothetical protein